MKQFFIYGGNDKTDKYKIKYKTRKIKYKTRRPKTIKSKSGYNSSIYNSKSKYSIHPILLLIFVIIAVLFKIILGFSSQHASFKSYYILRLADFFAMHGYPMFNDNLSINQVLIPPLMPVLIGLFSFIPGLTVEASGKLLTILFSSLLGFIVYISVLYISKNKLVALLSSIMALFNPLFFPKTISFVTQVSLAMPLSFIVLHLFSLMQTKKTPETAYICLIFFVLLALTSPIAIVVLLSLMVYLILSKIEGFRMKAHVKEFLLFTTLLTIWGFLVFYRNLINMVLFILQQHRISLRNLLLLNPLLIILALHSSYIILVNKNKSAMVWLSALITTISLMLLGFFRGFESFALLSSLLFVITSISITNIYNYARFLRLPKAQTLFIVLLSLFIISTMIIPCFVLAYNPSNLDFIDHKTVRLLNNIPKSDKATVAALIKEGFAVEYFSHNKALVDDNTRLTPSFSDLSTDLDYIFRLKLETVAMEKLLKYNIKYILLSDRAIAMYNQSRLYYEGDCVKPIMHQGKATLYEVICT